MIALDINELPLHRDDPSMWGQPGWPLSPPAIVQVDEGPSSRLPMENAYRCYLEIILKEQGGETHIERYVSENGAVVALEPHAANPGERNSLPEKLDSIKTRLGIGIKHLAAALGVERPTVYAWMKGERLPQQKRWERIQSLLELADHWQELSRHPLSRRIFVPFESGQSAMDLLSADTLDIPKVKKMLNSLAADENDRSARLKEKAVSMRERMKAKGAKPLQPEVVEQTMRNLGGW